MQNIIIGLVMFLTAIVILSHTPVWRELRRWIYVILKNH